MFDNLRDDTSFFDNDIEAAPVQSSSAPARPQRRKSHFLGMTPIQRFIVTMMMLIAVCMLGAVALLMTGKFWLA